MGNERQLTDDDIASLRSQNPSWVLGAVLDEIERLRGANVTAQSETERCIAIVQAARCGKVDGDFRCIIHWIQEGLDPRKGPRGV